MKHSITLIIFVLAIFVANAQNTASLDKLVRQTSTEEGMKHGMLAVSVYNANTGNPIYSYNGQLSMAPASVAKLLTTGVGFAQLGSDFRFNTKMCLRGNIDRDGILHGNIYIIGGGDPLLGSYRYRQTTPDSLFLTWLTAIRQKGIRRIDGRICYLSSIFDEQPLHDSWQWGDVGNYYGAGVYGLNFHENMYFVYFNSGSKLGYPATATSIKPKNLDIYGTCEVTTGPKGSGDQVVIYGAPNSKDRIYRGTVPLGCSNFSVRGALPNPSRSCAELFSSYLRTRNVNVSSNTTQVFTEPDSLRTILDYYSTDYYTIAQYTNLTSNNVYAESIFKYLGYKKYGFGTFENGTNAVKDYLRSKGLALNGIRIVDGSGLSRLNSSTTDFLCSYLATIRTEKFYNDFLHSLAEAGESGTAKNLLPNLPSNITVRIKTGTMDGVKSYSGYVIKSNGDIYSFAIISNNHECSDSAITAKLNKILMKIATLQ